MPTRSPHPPEGEDGAIAVLSAVLALAMLLAGSLAVDVGRVAYVSRDQQGATDRAALDGVRALEGGAPSSAEAYLESVVEPAVRASLERNVGSAGGMARDRHVERLSLLSAGGDAASDEDVVCSAGYAPDGSVSELTGAQCSSSVDDLAIDAVRVHTRSTVDFVLGLGQGPTEVTRSAMAAVEPRATVSAATTTASLEDGVVNELLSALTLGEVSLTAVGYDGLATAMVDLGLLGGSLADAGVSAGTVQELLDADISLVQLFDAMAVSLEASAAEADGALIDAAIDALEVLSAQVDAESLPTISLGDVLDLDEELLHLDTSGSAGIGAGVDAFSLVMAGLQVANQGEAVGLDAGVPGVTEVSLTVIEPPQIAVGPARQVEVDGDSQWVTIAETAQIDLAVELLPDTLGSTVGSAVSELLTGLLELLPDELVEGDVSLVEDPLDLSVSTGSGSVAVTGISCSDPGAVDVAAASEAAGLEIPASELLALDLSVLGLSLVDATVSVAADVELGEGSDTHTFTGPFPTDAFAVSAEELGLVGGLLEGLELVDSGEVLGEISLSEGELLDETTDILAALLEPVEDEVVTPLLQALGVDLGTVEARALQRDCTNLRLAE